MKRPIKSNTRMTCLLFAGLLCVSAISSSAAENEQQKDSSPANEVSEELVFLGNRKTDWRLFLGSMNNWSVPIQGPVTTSYKSDVLTVRTTDYQEKADAYQAEWQGGLGQVYWQRDAPLDLNAMEERGGALSIVIRVDERPKKKVEFKMDCGYPCQGTLKMTNLVEAVPLGQWFRISLALSCFKESGANLDHIFAPLVVATEGAFKMSFADVRIMDNPPPESVVACK